MNTLKPSEEKTLQAFVLALTQLERPISDDLQQSLYQLGTALAEKQPEAIAQVDALAQTQPHLQKLYEAARIDIQKAYKVQERAKSASFPMDVLLSPDLESWVADVFRSRDPALEATVRLRSAQSTAPAPSKFWDKSDRIMVMMAGGAAIGGMVAQIPGAIIGGVVAALYGWYISFAKPRNRKA
jgi:hypothetical protein